MLLQVKSKFVEDKSQREEREGSRKSEREPDRFYSILEAILLHCGGKQQSGAPGKLDNHLDHKPP